MNTLFGVDIWQDECLWDDPTADVAKRMHLRKESKTDFMENHRAYPLGKQTVLSEPVYTLVLYGGKEFAVSLSCVFLNQGDMQRPDNWYDEEVREEIAQIIEKSGSRVHDAIVPVLGKPKRDSIGRGDMREKVWRWDWNGHAILLTQQEGKYSALRILPSDRADHAGAVAKIKGTELRKRMASCVERRDNGDVFIRNIPMIDQGPKGYCSPATWERYLRYLDIPADMYQLALVANTGIGGGTSSREMAAATERLLSTNGRNLEPIDEPLTVESIAEHIDQGLPVMWHFLSTPDFQYKACLNTARRKGIHVQEKEKSVQSRNSESGGHICLIIGYNPETDEIAISDSWGPEFAERWIPVSDTAAMSYGKLNFIKW